MYYIKRARSLGRAFFLSIFSRRTLFRGGALGMAAASPGSCRAYSEQPGPRINLIYSTGSMVSTPRCFVSLGKVIKMRVGLIQTSLIWEDPQANRDALESKIREASGADLIVLPEMFTTGFSMNPEAAAVSTGDTTTK